MTCRYCGLDTGSGAGHRSQAECIQALSDEIDRAKRLIGNGREEGATHRRGETIRSGSEEHQSLNR